ncbi:MAG: haloalkane dehalogenase [Chloroflexaceae bacterium]|jgi:haloalkane dehalogenase|nr:haloalkane dehalogenase [Chloroflexaceae bacterium]
MEFVRTPDEHFENLPGYTFPPNYVTVDGLRIHYVDAGPADAPPVLLMHGEPSWSYLYRTMIPLLAEAGHRVIAPDLIGFGRSDKPVQREDYTYQRHVDWMHGFLNALDVQNATLVCQDWGGLIGLRLVAEQGGRFARVVAANTGLPTGDTPVSEVLLAWQQMSQTMPEFVASGVVALGCNTMLPEEVLAAYDAPFPDERYLAGARVFPMLIPTTPSDPAASANRAAWAALMAWHKPFLTAFSDGDPITSGAEQPFQTLIPGARGQAHVTISDAGHFLQEDKGEELAQVVLEFIART